MLNKRKAEINKRRAEIRTALETDPNVDVDALDTELSSLNDELTRIERRQSIANGINAGSIDGNSISNPLHDPQERSFDRETVLSTKEYRSAWAKTLMGRKLNTLEQRALDTALTTTATAFAAATEDADGVNNGGLFIPTDINTALLEAISLVSPIFRDVNKTAIPGFVKFPYKKTSTGAKNRKETEVSPDASIEWAELTLGTSEISVTIPVSWRLEAMAIDEFVGYIQSELLEQVQDQIVTAVIYGTGTNEIEGATVKATIHTYTDKVLDAIGAALGKLSAKLKIGAKIYVSQAIVEEISFTKDTTGNYVYTPINSAGVSSIATYKVEVDPYLNAGDFLIGNIHRYYRLNTNEKMTLTKDSSGKKRRNEYTAFTIMSGAAQPGALIYGKKSS